MEDDYRDDEPLERDWSGERKAQIEEFDICQHRIAKALKTLVDAHREIWNQYEEAMDVAPGVRPFDIVQKEIEKIQAEILADTMADIATPNPTLSERHRRAIDLLNRTTQEIGIR